MLLQKQNIQRFDSDTNYPTLYQKQNIQRSKQVG